MAAVNAIRLRFWAWFMFWVLSPSTIEPVCRVQRNPVRAVFLTFLVQSGGGIGHQAASNLEGFREAVEAVTSAVDQAPRRFQVVLEQSGFDLRLLAGEKTGQELGGGFRVVRTIGSVDERRPEADCVTVKRVV